MPSLPRLTFFSLAAALTTTAAARTETPPKGDAPEIVVERFPVAKGGTLLLVPVELKGKTFRLVAQ